MFYLSRSSWPFRKPTIPMPYLKFTGFRPHPGIRESGPKYHIGILVIHLHFDYTK
jgi:hypothetical protein